MPDELEPQDLLFMPEHGADPIWSADGSTMIELDALPISDALASELRDWSKRWEGLSWQREARTAGEGSGDGEAAGAGDEDPANHDADGRALAERLREELGAGWRMGLQTGSGADREVDWGA